MNMTEIYESKDRRIVPFLLTQDGVNFIGIKRTGSIVYFRFTPKDKCEVLVNQFSSRKAPLVQPKDLLDAVETFKDRVFEMKDEKYGEDKD